MENKEMNLQKPTFWSVLGAYSVDALLLWVWGIFAIVLAVQACRVLGQDLLPHIGWLVLWNAVGPVAGLLYFLISEGKTGASYGKRKFRLQTIPAKTDVLATRKRILASYIVDIVLLTIVYLPLYFFISLGVLLLTESIGPFVVLLNSVGGGYLLCGIPLLVFYFAVCESSFGFSIGKKICGLHVCQQSK